MKPFPSNHWFYLFNTSLIQYLYQMRSKPNETSNTSHLQRLKYLHYGLLLVELLRALYLSELPPDSLFAHLSYNPLMTSLTITFKFLTPAVLKAVCLMVLFAIYVDYSMYFKLDYFLLHLFHQLTIDNAEEFFDINKKVLKVPQWSYLKPIQCIHQCYNLQKYIWHSKNLQFKHQQLDSFPFISAQLRARIIVLSTFIEFVFAVMNAFYG